MQITVVTLFPGMFSGPLSESIIARALKRNIASVDFVNPRDFATDAYKTVDDHPYGGGHGMIMRVDILDEAISDAKARHNTLKHHTVLMDPQGTPYVQAKAREFSAVEHLILVAGHYEGIDERVRSLVDEEISLGDYILTCGEIPALTIIDSTVRLLEGTLAKTEATADESFSDTGLLEYPQYTRPPEYKGMAVPEILLSGHHANITRWRQEEAVKRTGTRRPDLHPTAKTDRC